MTVIKQESLVSRSRRTAAILEIETDLIRRFENYLDRWLDIEEKAENSVLEMARISDFVDTFVEDFHFGRVERALDLCQKGQPRRFSMWANRFQEHQGHLRERLEGMRRASNSADLGSETAYRWGAKALRKVLDRYLTWAENTLLPVLRTHVSDDLDLVISTALHLDEAKEVSQYAEAESLLIL